MPYNSGSIVYEMNYWNINFNLEFFLAQLYRKAIEHHDFLGFIYTGDVEIRSCTIQQLTQESKTFFEKLRDTNMLGNGLEDVGRGDARAKTSENWELTLCTLRVKPC